MAIVTVTATIKRAIRNIAWTNYVSDVTLLAAFDATLAAYLRDTHQYKVADGELNGSDGIDLAVPETGAARYEFALPSGSLIAPTDANVTVAIDDTDTDYTLADLINDEPTPTGGEIVVSGLIYHPLTNEGWVGGTVTVQLTTLFATTDGVYPPCIEPIKINEDGEMNGADGLVLYVPTGVASQWRFIFPDGTVATAQLDSSMTTVDIGDVLAGMYTEYNPVPITPDYATDEAGNIFTDESGNRFVLQGV